MKYLIISLLFLLPVLAFGQNSVKIQYVQLTKFTANEKCYTAHFRSTCNSLNNDCMFFSIGGFTKFIRRGSQISFTNEYCFTRQNNTYYPQIDCNLCTTTCISDGCTVTIEGKK